MKLGALRKEGEPLTTRGIVRKVMEVRGMNTADKAMVDTINVRMASSLRKLLHRARWRWRTVRLGCGGGSWLGYCQALLENAALMENANH